MGLNTLAIPLVLRNDNYGFQLNERINLFIDYYKSTPPDISSRITLYIVDWNPPPESVSLREAFDWNILPFNLVYYTVSADDHLSIKCPAPRPIYDYLGRNIVSKIARDSHILIINQDILLPFELLRECLELPDNHFLRADRVDYDWYRTSIRDHFDIIQSDGCCIDEFAQLKTFQRLVDEDTSQFYTLNHNSRYQHLFEVDDGSALVFNASTRINSLSFFISKCIYFLIRHFPLRSLCNRLIKYFSFLSNFIPPSGYLHKHFPAHTNASGDFICVSISDFLSVGGYPFSPNWYMHVDGYLLYKLFAYGLSQRYYVASHFVHLDHSRSERQNRSESLKYEHHMSIWDKYFVDKSLFTYDYNSWSNYLSLFAKYY